MRVASLVCFWFALHRWFTLHRWLLMHHVRLDHNVSVVGLTTLLLGTLSRQLLLGYHMMSHGGGSRTNTSHHIAVWRPEAPHVLTAIAITTRVPSVVRFELETILTWNFGWGFRGWVKLMKISPLLKSRSLIAHLAFRILYNGEAHFLLLLLTVLNDVWILWLWLRLRLLVHNQPMRRNLIKILCRS